MRGRCSGAGQFYSFSSSVSFIAHEWNDGQKHGLFYQTPLSLYLFTVLSGDSYDGEWSDGQRHGRGEGPSGWRGRYSGAGPGPGGEPGCGGGGGPGRLLV